jgi:hypothetical protein
MTLPNSVYDPNKPEDSFTPHKIYRGIPDPDAKPLIIKNGDKEETLMPICINVIKPTDQATGELRDQTFDAAANMRYSHSLGLGILKRQPLPRNGRCIIVGGAPSIKNHLEEIRQLAKDPANKVFCLNWTHTWLIQNGIIPDGCTFFEIDAEPDTILDNAHKEITYFICSHCHPKTFDSLKDYKRVLWLTPPNSPAEEVVMKEIYPDAEMCGGGISTFTRTMTVALFLGFRSFDLFGCDSSFPENASGHVNGYETPMDPIKDALAVWAKDEGTGEARKFMTYGYLALQHEEFKTYCLQNHHVFSLRVHGDSLLQWSHMRMFPSQYRNDLI